ncbi:hypothetical protein PIB30_081515 [Stylosanthes scabra]|uniref:Uncharacterized protein n=1 Tax=Stylosanthes scabra TaxID=79078 RepID=A0ABU6XQJ6_9FABA|nr:hypothetical protein [Stylosanthes scabra]
MERKIEDSTDYSPSSALKELVEDIPESLLFIWSRTRYRFRTRFCCFLLKVEEDDGMRLCTSSSGWARPQLERVSRVSEDRAADSKGGKRYAESSNTSLDQEGSEVWGV